MKKQHCYIYFLTVSVLVVGVFFLMLPPELLAQSRDQLERNKQNLEKEIRDLTRLLNDNRRTAQANTMQLILLNKQINAREDLINTNEAKLRNLNRQINSQTNLVGRLAADLETLMQSYANMIRYAYKSRSAGQRLSFLFSSKSFNQAFKRLKYLREYSKHRQAQAQKIELTRLGVEKEITELNGQKAQLLALQEEQRVAKLALESEKKEKDKVSQQLSAQERNLTRSLQQRENARRELERQITRLIEEERRRAAQRAREEGRPVEPGTLAMTPEQQLLSSRFAENIGRLPWPVESGVITGNFGSQPHPTLRNIRIQNDGVEIATVPNARARAIFDGTVTARTRVGGFYAVIVNHGEYLSVYTNLASVSVSVGQKVSTRQEIGTVGTSTEDEKTATGLQIWKGLTKLNPANWLAPR